MDKYNTIQYLHCLASSATTDVLLQRAKHDMGVLETWMTTNYLRLNPSKTQFIWLGTLQQLAKLDLSAIAVDLRPYYRYPCCPGHRSYDGPRAHFLSSYAECDSYYCEYAPTPHCSLPPIPDATATLTHPFITARLDYCCSLYAGLQIGRLRYCPVVSRALSHASQDVSPNVAMAPSTSICWV